MGCTISTSELRVPDLRVCLPDKDLTEPESRTEVRLLFLGSAGTGKSTLMKQIRMIHGSGYSQEERLLFRQDIYDNTIEGMRVLLQGMRKLRMDLTDQDLDKDMAAFLALSPKGAELTPALGRLAHRLWRRHAVQEAYRRCHEIRLSDAAVYFLQHLPRLAGTEYVPSEQDILHCRVETRTIIDISVEIRGVTFRLIDVGGQRSERRKWIHCFQGVTAVLFCVSLAAFDTRDTSSEQRGLNQMTESLNIFDGLWNSHWLEGSTFFLFLNKSDVFKEKLLVSKLSDAFPSYKGGNDYESATAFVQKMFLDVASRTNKAIFVHCTCATNKENVQLVFHVVAELILRDNMKSAGLF
ncbi:guanine nucleotide-binding protein G(i) subunit alpha-2-like [Amphibalanus amphitrite]|uniref:guanine nucleotide-binding protein G(i) subunit alpha-2-like n=1 Tax=Amphibalanus amphitrite TaxID=1232801 RepID=UPI001C909240|nr:guanine nucleotide-binding protein G(i) subunit alpha-2-like [Amphibalanus amphitrite]